MRSLWRITHGRYARNCLDGMGASLVGGRWNLPGTRVAYLAESRALALLEMLVHVDLDLAPVGWCFVEVRVPATLRVAAIEQRVNALPEQWRAIPATKATQVLGSSWAEGQDTALMSVPSVVLPKERNFLLNPLHDEFAKMEVGDSEPLTFDPRLMRRSPPA